VYAEYGGVRLNVGEMPRLGYTDRRLQRVFTVCHAAPIRFNYLRRRSRLVALKVKLLWELGEA